MSNLHVEFEVRDMAELERTLLFNDELVSWSGGAGRPEFPPVFVDPSIVDEQYVNGVLTGEQVLVASNPDQELGPDGFVELVITADLFPLKVRRRKKRHS